jgi:hypothetical protein
MQFEESVSASAFVLSPAAAFLLEKRARRLSVFPCAVHLGMSPFGMLLIRVIGLLKHL